jgi:hypothetical protein
VDTKNKFVASVGAAYLYDLIQSVPNGDEIAGCLVDKYGQIAGAQNDRMHSVFFDPEYVGSRTVRMAIGEIDKQMEEGGSNPFFVTLGE